MAKSLIKVLQVNANIQGYGGVSEFLFNVYKNIDKDKVKFDFLSPNKTTYGIYKNEINKMGGDLYELNIGHSIISRAVFVGLDKAVKEMLNLVNKI